MFYDISEAISEGAAGFLKYRNSKEMGKFIEDLWINEYSNSLIYHECIH